MGGRKKRDPRRKTVQIASSKSRISNDSVYPSYSKFQVTYPVVCRQRYHQDKLRYDKQFEYELKMLELMQNSAYDSMRFHRHVAITTLWPPLHTKKEIDSGSKPLEIWDVTTKNGHAKRVTDEDLKLMSFELMGANVATTFMVAPKCPCPSLAVKLPFLVLLVKNLKKFFSFEIQILDDRNMLRRFRASNYQSATRVDNFCTSMPLALTPGWNQIQFNLADFTRRAYGTNYIETVRIQIHANVRVKRVYFCDRLYADDELPAQLRLHPPLRPCKINELARRAGRKPAEAVETVRPPTPEKESDQLGSVTAPLVTIVEPDVNVVEQPVVNLLESVPTADEVSEREAQEETNLNVETLPVTSSAVEIAVQY